MPRRGDCPIDYDGPVSFLRWEQLGRVITIGTTCSLLLEGSVLIKAVLTFKDTVPRRWKPPVVGFWRRPLPGKYRTLLLHWIYALMSI